MSALKGYALTDARVRDFDQNDYVVLPRLFSPDEAAQIRAVFMDQVQDGPVAGLSEIKNGPDGYDASDPLAFYPRMMNPHRHPELAVGPVSKEFLLSPRLFPSSRRCWARSR